MRDAILINKVISASPDKKFTTSGVPKPLITPAITIHLFFTKSPVIIAENPNKIPIINTKKTEEK